MPVTWEDARRQSTLVVGVCSILRIRKLKSLAMLGTLKVIIKDQYLLYVNVTGLVS